MARKPNYRFERNERARAKAEKKAERQQARQARRDGDEASLADGTSAHGGASGASGSDAAPAESGAAQKTPGEKRSLAQGTGEQPRREEG